MRDDRKDIVEYADRLLTVYRQSTRKERSEGRNWYVLANAACKAISREHSVAFKRVVYATAALSNNMDWEQNVSLADNVTYDIVHGLTPYGHFATLLDKAKRILLNGEFTALSGPKVVPFARAIYRPHCGAAVVDRWMWRVASGHSDKSLTPARLRKVQVALRRVARKVRRPVSDVQAIVWIAIRNNPIPLPF